MTTEVLNFSAIKAEMLEMLAKVGISDGEGTKSLRVALNAAIGGVQKAAAEQFVADHSDKIAHVLPAPDSTFNSLNIRLQWVSETIKAEDGTETTAQKWVVKYVSGTRPTTEVGKSVPGRESTSVVFGGRELRALAQIFEVVRLVKIDGYDRVEAIRTVAQKRRIAYQTVIDKLDRQLGLRAYQADRLLEDSNLPELEALLKARFPDHPEAIERFFSRVPRRPGWGAPSLAWRTAA